MFTKNKIHLESLDPFFLYLYPFNILPCLSKTVESMSMYLPAWVQQPDMQRAEWLNALIKRTWPHLEESCTPQ